MPKPFTTEEIRQKIYEKSEDTLVEGYVYRNQKTILDIVCHYCGDIYHVSWNSFDSQDVRCHCRKAIKIRENQSIKFPEFLKELNKYGYTTEYNGENYTGSKMKILTKCPDGHDYSTSYGNFVYNG